MCFCAYLFESIESVSIKFDKAQLESPPEESSSRFYVTTQQVGRGSFWETTPGLSFVFSTGKENKITQFSGKGQTCFNYVNNCSV
jgi:hypothetical protein